MKARLATSEPVTSPPVAEASGSVNTVIVADDGRLIGDSTDGPAIAAAIASEVGERYTGVVTVLGAGGVAPALREAAGRLGCALHLRRHAELAGARVGGACAWTWPEEVDPPAGLRLDGARVAIIAYGAPGRALATRVEQLGGTAVACGEGWFEAQATAQRRLWTVDD